MVRETIWGGLVETSTALGAANTAAITNVTGAGLLAIRPFTVVRSRFSILVQSDQNAATEFQQMAVGACVVSDQAVAIGATAVPTPMTDKDSDAWFVYEGIMNQFLVISAIGAMSSAGTQRVIDSRAMRKVEDGFQIIVVIENSGLSSGSTIGLVGRFLLKLH